MGFLVRWEKPQVLSLTRVSIVPPPLNSNVALGELRHPSVTEFPNLANKSIYLTDLL